MTDTLHLIRENKRVESIDPALPLALAWADAHPEMDGCAYALRAFIDGYRQAQIDLAGGIASDVAGILDQVVQILRLHGRLEALDREIGEIQALRDGLLGLGEADRAPE